MKKLLPFYLIMFSLFLVRNSYSQAYVEQNSGVTTSLTSVSINPDLYSWYINAWICGYNGVVLKTTNSGSNWINISGNGIPNTVDLVNIFCIDTNHVITTGFSSTGTHVYRTSNGGANWHQVFSQANGFINAVWMKTPLQGFIYGDPVGTRWSLWKTSNGGLNWDSTGIYLPQAGTENGWNNALFVSNNKIWFGTNNHRIYYSSNFGTNWFYGATTELNSTAIWFYHIDSLFGYYGGANSYKTTNGGQSWILLNCPGAGNFTGFCYGVFGVTNGASPPVTSWTVRNNNNIYQNLQMSNWIVDYTAPAGSYTHIGTNYNGVLLFTWAVRSNGGITRVVTAFVGLKKISSVIPEDFRLHQNYPNPFNPVTKIKFSLPAVGERHAFHSTKLIIYDILGREIAVLVNEQLNPGTYEVDWDASSYTSGVYFYKLFTSDYTETRKMVLVK